MEDSNKNKRQKQLPYDVISQHILPRLPIKTLTQSKVVSKQWYSSLTSSNFILHHTKQPLFSHPGSPVETLFIQHGNDYYLYSCENDDNVVDYDENNDNLVKLDVEFDIDEDDSIILVGCSNGLVCLADILGKYFFLYNPTTNKSHKYYLEDFGELVFYHPDVTWGFGYVSSINDYKIVRIILFNDVHVYSVKSNSWRKIEFSISEDGLLLGPAKLVNETLYWTKTTNGEISRTLGFNLVSETFDWFPRPAIDSVSEDVLCVMGGCLSNCGSNSENEVMFNIVRSPRRVVNVCFACDFRLNSRDEVIGFTKTGKVFVADTNRRMISLLDRNSKRTLVEFEDENETHIQSYVPSQASPLPSTTENLCPVQRVRVFDNGLIHVYVPPPPPRHD